MFGYTTQHE